MRVCLTTAEVGYRTKQTTSMGEVYSKDAVVFELSTCVKMCRRHQRSQLITTNYLECCKLSYLLYLPSWHFTLLPFSCSTLKTSLLARAIAQEGSCELKDYLKLGKPSLIKKQSRIE